MFDVAPWKSTTSRMPAFGSGGMCTMSSRRSPPTVIVWVAVPGSYPAPRRQVSAAAVVLGAGTDVGEDDALVVGASAFDELLDVHAVSRVVASTTTASGVRLIRARRGFHRRA